MSIGRTYITSRSRSKISPAEMHRGLTFTKNNWLEDEETGSMFESRHGTNVSASLPHPGAGDFAQLLVRYF